MSIFFFFFEMILYALAHLSTTVSDGKSRPFTAFVMLNRTDGWKERTKLETRQCGTGGGEGGSGETEIKEWPVQQSDEVAGLFCWIGIVLR